MGGLMWIVFFALLALLILSLLWLVWKLRHFSQSQQNQTYLDDKLLHAMLKDQNFSKKIKKALVKKADGTDADQENTETDQQEKKPADPAA